MEQYNYMPIGTVVSYAGVTTPIGWLLCDGRTIEEHEYPDLYRVLGSGILPDLRGEFGKIIKAFNTTTDTETLPIQMAKALNNKIENNYNDQLDATVDIVGKEFYDYIQNSGEKTAGKIYRDRLQKGIFRCLKTTTSVLNTSEFYEPISNNDLSTTVEKSGNWYIIRHGNKFKEFLISTVTQAKPDGSKIAFPENFTDINSINIQMTENTSIAAPYTAVGIVGFSEVTLSGFTFRLNRPNDVVQAPELFNIRVFGI